MAEKESITDLGAQDRILWIHILIQTFAWGILFPIGMVLGVSGNEMAGGLELTRL
jgi:hypothetical protein